MLLPVPIDLSKLWDVAKNYVAKKDVYSAKIKIVKDKIPDITKIVTETALNVKISEFKGEIRLITNLATKAALNVFENEIPSVSNLVKKTDCKTKINEIEKKINCQAEFILQVILDFKICLFINQHLMRQS